MKIDLEKIWRHEELFIRSFDECTACIKAVLKEAQLILQSPPYTPPEFDIKMGAIPDEMYSIRRNLFSTLFQSVYYLLKIEPQRRNLYGKLNYLFRMWVTSGDNLLDNEDKVVVPIDICGSSRVMRQVVSIMLADRIMNNITREAVDSNVISQAQASVISHKSLQILLPSAAEEASEENGITSRPGGDYILNTIHKLKTGLLFHIPFLGPDHIEEGLDTEILALCKDGLMSFGIGCQILDDIRDIAKDNIEARHNYVLSLMYAENPGYVEKLIGLGPAIDVSSNIYSMFPDVVNPAADKALGLLVGGLLSLGAAGLGINKNEAIVLSYGMFETLGVGELINVATFKQ